MYPYYVKKLALEVEMTRRDYFFENFFFFIKNSVFVETRRSGRVEITKKTNNKCQVGIIESHYFVSVLFFFVICFISLYIHRQWLPAIPCLKPYTHICLITSSRFVTLMYSSYSFRPSVRSYFLTFFFQSFRLINHTNFENRLSMVP